MLPYALKVWGRDEKTLFEYGNWCGAMYGFGHDLIAPHGPAIDKIDKLCKQWRQQTRCLFESDLCDTGSDFYTIKTFDNNTFACENTVFDRCGYEKCIMDLQTVEHLKLYLVEGENNDHVEQADKKETLPSIVLKSSWSGHDWVDKIYSDVSKQVKKCCHIGLGHFTVFDEVKSECLEVESNDDNTGDFHKLCLKNEITPSYASQSKMAFSKTGKNHRSELVIDGILNSELESKLVHEPTENYDFDVQSTGYSRDRKWLIIDYLSDQAFNQIAIHTRFDTCERCYSRLTVQLLGDKGSESGWCKFESGKYSTPPKFTVEKGQVLKFDCGAQVGRYVRIARPSGTLTMDEVNAYSYEC